MVIDIERLTDTLALDGESRTDELSRLILEFIAIKNDNDIMTELMLQMVEDNAQLNRTLKEKYQELEKVSVTDQLTGIYNRRRFISMLESELTRLKRYSNHFSLIMFDIDHFKSVNDTYGHDIGDFVLKEITTIISDRLRSTDTFARWGGEEFMILAPETSVEEANDLAQNLRKLVENHDFSPVKNLTCSFGVFSTGLFTDSNSIETIEVLTKPVDEALYMAKNKGRNQVVIFENER